MSVSAPRRRAVDVGEVTALLVDSQPFLRAGLRSVLERGQVRVVGEASDAATALRIADETSPDVVLVDMALPESGGLETTSRMRREQPKCAVILLAGQEDESAVYEALTAGAAAFVGKNIDPDALVEVVRRVAGGEWLINDQMFRSPAVANRVLSAFRDLSAFGPQAQLVFSPLSPREMQILDQIANGMTNKLVAAELGISEQTVKNHLSSILRKLSVNDRTQAVVYAIRAGWIAMPSD